ncbi:hypothetical protein SODG_006820 [Sodalis praecaptivus]
MPITHPGKIGEQLEFAATLSVFELNSVKSLKVMSIGRHGIREGKHRRFHIISAKQYYTDIFITS